MISVSLFFNNYWKKTSTPVWLATLAVLGTAPYSQASLRPNIEAKVRRAATRANLDPGLVLAIVEAESNYNPKAKSHAGAEGLMQLMPKTANSLAVTNSFHIHSNVTAGCEYFRRLLTEFRTVEMALAAYNAGPAKVRKYRGIPPFQETRSYIRKVLALWKKRAG